MLDLISLWPNNIDIGTLAATFGNSINAIMFVPKLLRTMGQDDALPLLKYLAKGYGESKEPYRAHVFTLIASSVIFIIGIEEYSLHII